MAGGWGSDFSGKQPTRAGRIFRAVVLLGLGFMFGALTQASSELQREDQGTEFCVPLYDQPGIERVQCDPADGAR